MVYAMCVKKHLTYAIDAFDQVFHWMKLICLGQGERYENVEKQILIWIEFY